MCTCYSKELAVNIKKQQGALRAARDIEHRQRAVIYLKSCVNSGTIGEKTSTVDVHAIVLALSCERHEVDLL